MIKLFISHSSADHVLVAPLIDLIRAALNLPAADIRCTSVDGYRLPGGAKTTEQLRRETQEAIAFIGVLSEASLGSTWVSAELGARWGADKHLLPLLAPGVSPSVLNGPLAGLNALSCEHRAQVLQLLEDLAQVLHVPLQPGSSFEHQLQTLIDIAEKSRASQSEPEATSSSPSPVTPELDEFDLKVLKAVAKRVNASAHHVADELQVSPDRAAYSLEELVHTHRLVRKFYNFGPGHFTQYELTHEGRGFLIQRGDIR